jgi:hypothetical protein
MKTFFSLVVMCVFCGAGALAQTSVNSASITMLGSPKRAEQVALAPAQDLREHSTITSAQGEKPLWELMPEPQFVSLGEIARQIRKEHETAKKAVRVWKN